MLMCKDLPNIFYSLWSLKVKVALTGDALTKVKGIYNLERGIGMMRQLFGKAWSKQMMDEYSFATRRIFSPDNNGRGQRLVQFVSRTHGQMAIGDPRA